MVAHVEGTSVRHAKVGYIVILYHSPKIPPFSEEVQLSRNKEEITPPHKKWAEVDLQQRSVKSITWFKTKQN